MTNLRIAEYKGAISTGNGTTDILTAGAIFTGEWEDIADYAIIKVNVYSDQAAASGGLDFQQSPDQTIIFDEPYDLAAGDKKLFTPNPVANYFRIVYTNGAVDQTEFSLQTIYSSVYAKPSSHRLSDTLSGNDDTEVVKSAISFLNEVDDEYKNVGIQNPFPVDGDSVYAKDIWVAQSIMGDFSGSVTDLFDNLHSVIVDSTATNPKELFIHFNRTIISNIIGLGSFSGDFSNTKIEVYNSGAIATTVVDESSDSTKYTTRTFQIPVTVGFNAIKFSFATTDTVTLSNSVILKSRSMVSRLQATSELTGLVEDVLSFRGALNVTDPLVHKLGVNEYFTREVGNNTTLAIAAVIGDTSINVVSVAGLVSGDQIQITENGTAEIGILAITNIAALVITLDRPLANNFPIGTNVKEVENNMTSLAGTLASPISYRVAPPAGQVWQITRVLVSMTDGTASMDDDKFGGLTALTNGAVGRAETIGGRTVNITNWKANRDLVNDMYDVNYPTRTPAGTYSMRGRWTFTNAQFIVELDGDESHYIEILIQDNLTAQDTFRVKAQGRIFGG